MRHVGPAAELQNRDKNLTVALLAWLNENCLAIRSIFNRTMIGHGVACHRRQPKYIVGNLVAVFGAGAGLLT